MQCSTQGAYGGYTVHFGMQQESASDHLLLHAIRGDHAYDYVPASLFLFHGKFPAAFPKDFVFWYIHSLADIVLCPITDPSFSASRLARLKRSDSAVVWQFRRCFGSSCDAKSFSKSAIDITLSLGHEYSICLSNENPQANLYNCARLASL